MAVLIEAAVVAAELEPRTRVRRKAHAVTDLQACARCQRNFDRNRPAVAIGLARVHVDAAEEAAVRQRDVELGELARVKGFARMKRQVRAHERLPQHVLTKVDRPERIAAAGIEPQHDVGRMLLRKDVDPILDELGIRVAAPSREVGPARLQRLVGAVTQHTATLECGGLLRRDELRIRRGFALEKHIQLADTHRLAGHDRERHAPAVTHAVLL